MYSCKIQQENERLRDEIKIAKIGHPSEFFCSQLEEKIARLAEENNRLMETVHELHVSRSVAKAKLDEIEKYLRSSSFTGFNVLDFVERFFPKAFFFPKPSPKIKVGDRVEILVDHKCGWIFRGNKGKVVRIDGNLEMPLVIRFDDGMVMADYAHIRKVE
jgi:hypothetical protein